MAMPNITPEQIRAARAILRWSRKDCGRNSGVSVETIKNVEYGQSEPKAETLIKLKQCFISFGILFVSLEDQQPPRQGVMYSAEAYQGDLPRDAVQLTNNIDSCA